MLAAVLGVTLLCAAPGWAGGVFVVFGNQVNANIKTDDGGTAPIFDVIFPSGFVPSGGTCGPGCTMQTGANGNPSDIEFFLSTPAASINAVITLNTAFACTSGNTITDRISRDRSTYIAQAPLACSQPVPGPPPPPPPPKNCDSERAAVAVAAARVGSLQAAIDVFRATEIQPALDKLNEAIARTVKLAKELDLVPVLQNGVRLRAGLALNTAQAEMEDLTAKLKELSAKLRNLRDALRNAQKDLQAAEQALSACLNSAVNVRQETLLRPTAATRFSSCSAEQTALSAAGMRLAAYRALARIAPAASFRHASNGLADASRQLQTVATVLAANGPKAATALADTKAILGLIKIVIPATSRIARAAGNIRAKQAAAEKNVAAARTALAKCQTKPPQTVSVSQDDTWAYNPAIGKSNVCINVRTTPAQVSVSAKLDGPNGYHAVLGKTPLQQGGVIQTKSVIREAGDYTSTVTVYDANGTETAMVTKTLTVTSISQNGPATNPPCQSPTQ